MKFIVFWEYRPEEREKILAKREEIKKEFKQNPEKYPRRMRLQDGTAIIFGMIGKFKGISLVEVDNEEQMQNLVQLRLDPLLKFTFVPIIQTPMAKKI